MKMTYFLNVANNIYGVRRILKIVFYCNNYIQLNDKYIQFYNTDTNTKFLEPRYI